MIDNQHVRDWVEKNVTNIESREYQIEAWGNLWQSRTEQGRERGLIHLATGLGKTSVAAVDVLHFIKEEDTTGRVLFVSHMNDISLQAEQTFKRVDNNLTTYFFKGRKLKEAQVTFATFQSLYYALDEIDPDYFSYIIWDEAHHIEATTFNLVRRHFNTKFQLGLTATPERSDGLDITEYFGKAVYHKSLAEGINEGWLSIVDYHIVFDQAIKDAMKEGFNTKNRSEIEELFSIRTRNEIISKEVLDRRHEIGLDLAKTIVFCKNIAVAKQMAVLLNGEVYHSKLKMDERRNIFKRFKDGSLQVICTVDMFNEGVDIPDARLIVFLRATSSRTIFEQQLGRGLRRHPGKNKVTVLDFAANIERINFVKELGRHSGGFTTSGGWKRDAAEGELTNVDKENASTFEFEDEVVELLRRYDELARSDAIPLETIIEAYERHDKNGVRAGQELGISANAVYKRLRAAGIDTSGHIKRHITSEVTAEAYYRLGSAQKAAVELGITSSLVLDRLEQGGYKPIDHYPQKYSDEEILQAYQKANRSTRGTAQLLGVGRDHVVRRLRKLNIDMSRTFAFTKEKIDTAYEKYDGDIVKIVEELKSKKGNRILLRWALVYKALDRHGYIENYNGKVTSARAAAAYYKYGTAIKAGKVLGVSGSYVSRITENAKYIRKYKRKKIHDTK